MKKTRIAGLLTAALFTIFFVSVCMAAADTNAVPAAPGVMTPSAAGNGLVLALLPVIVPLLVALGKGLLPKVPTWILPILAPALGALIDFLTAKATGGTASPVLALALGSAGVGLREIYDQTKTRIKDGPAPTPDTVPK